MGERILSIQSHVVFGYVGGKAAVFPLQCLGFDVDVINTVNFSNHTGYGRFGGTRTTTEELKNLFKHLEENELLAPSRLVTGYIPGHEAVAAVMDLARKLKERNPNLIFLLDPVLGDSGRMYVAPEVIPIQRNALPLATIITPNWFEVEVITDTKLTDVRSIKTALKILHETYKVPNVVISSIPLGPLLRAALPAPIRQSSEQDQQSNHTIDESDGDSSYLLCVSSAYIGGQGNGDQGLSAVHAACVPLISGYFSGVGDLFSALVLAHYDPKASAKVALANATSEALTKTHAILSQTHEYARTLPSEEQTATDEEKDEVSAERLTKRMRGRELRIVQGQDIIRGTAKGVVKREMVPWHNFWE